MLFNREIRLNLCISFECFPDSVQFIITYDQSHSKSALVLRGIQNFGEKLSNPSKSPKLPKANKQTFPTRTRKTA